MTRVARGCVCRPRSIRSTLHMLTRGPQQPARDTGRVEFVGPWLLERMMNTIGLLGGMSWESTAIYYRLINQLARLHRGRLHSAPLLMWSADFEDIRRLQIAGEWDKTAEILATAARQLEHAGARGDHTVAGDTGGPAALHDVADRARPGALPRPPRRHRRSQPGRAEFAGLPQGRERGTSQGLTV